MHDGTHFMLHQHACHQFKIADIADDQLCATHRLAKTGAQVVYDDDPFAPRHQLLDDVTADVTGAAGDEDCFHE